MKSIFQKGIIPARTQSQDTKFQTSRPCEVRRSGQVTTFLVCAVFSLSFQAVVVLNESCYKSSVFFNQVWDEWMDLRNSNGVELRNSYFTTVRKLFSKIFIRSVKMHHVELNWLFPNSILKLRSRLISHQRASNKGVKSLNRCFQS